jgi:hypothetical protein
VDTGPQERRIDLGGMPFNNWLIFVFDRPVTPTREAWYTSGAWEIDLDPARHIANLSQVFRQPEALIGRYSPGQIEQGFWFLFGPGVPWFEGLLWDAAVPWETRQECIAALPGLYALLFERCALDTIPYMLPDLLASDYRAGLRQPAASEEDRRVQQALFGAFGEMLTSGHPGTQRAALHGLGHLSHPRTPDLVRAYLEARPELDPALRRYARYALAGEVL